MKPHPLKLPAHSQYFNLVPLKPNTKYPGTPLALFGDRAICANKENIAAVGWAGSMKTYSVMINSIIASRDAEECMVIADQRDELYTATAQTLIDSGYEVKRICLSPGAETSKWNPFNDDVFWADKEVPEAAADIAHRLLTHFRATDETNDIDFAIQKTLLTAAILHVHRSEEPSNLTTIYKFLQNSIEEIKNEIYKSSDNCNKRDVLNWEPRERFNSFIESSGNKTNSAREELLRKLAFCNDDGIATLTTTSEVDLQHLLGYTVNPNPDYDPHMAITPNTDPASIPPPVLEKYHKCAYFIIEPRKYKAPENALGTLFLQMAMDNIAKTDMMGFPKLDRPVHFILDEFASVLWRAPEIVQNISLLEGKARFTVSIQGAGCLPKSSSLNKLLSVFQSYVFLSPQMFLPVEKGCERIVSEICMDGSDAAAVYESFLRADNRFALVWSRGCCAVVGNKAYAGQVYPEIAIPSIGDRLKALHDKQ